MGPRDLIGQTFTMPAPAGIDNVGIHFFPSREGLKGSWMLRKYENTLSPVVWAYNILFPVIEDVSPRYSQVQQLAKMLELIDATPEDQRPKLLQSLALSPVPEISFAAIKKLREVQQKDTVKMFCELLANPQLTISGQIAIDEILSQRSDTNWRTSPQRLKLLQAWVSSEKLSEYKANHIISRLSSALQADELATPAFLDLLKILLQADGFSSRLKEQAIKILIQIPADRNNKDSVANFLLEQIKKNNAMSIKIASARTLLMLTRANKIHLAPRNLAEIQSAKEDQQDVTLKGILDDIIKATK